MALPAQAVDAPFPQPTGYVVDQAGFVPDQAERVAAAELTDWFARSGQQVAVAVVDYEEVTADSEADYINDLFAEWGVGSAERDDGILLLIGTAGGSGNRALRLEVGFGLEGDFTDVQADRVYDRVRELLRAGDAGGAVLAGQRGIRRELGDTEVPVDDTSTTTTVAGAAAVGDPFLGGEPGTSFGADSSGPSGGGVLLLFLLIMLLVLWSQSRRSRRRRRRRRWFDDDDHDGGGGVFPVPIFIGGGGWGGGGGSWGGGLGGGGFGGGGGGFGGFGGGGSGGGGAGGGW